jgi:hypothetical protein
MLANLFAIMSIIFILFLMVCMVIFSACTAGIILFWVITDIFMNK